MVEKHSLDVRCEAALTAFIHGSRLRVVWVLVAQVNLEAIRLNRGIRTVRTLVGPLARMPHAVPPQRVVVASFELTLCTSVRLGAGVRADVQAKRLVRECRIAALVAAPGFHLIVNALLVVAHFSRRSECFIANAASVDLQRAALVIWRRILG